MALPAWLAEADDLVGVHHRPPADGRTAPWPVWVSPRVRQAWEHQGVREPWVHQVQAAEAAFAGRHVALATGTASGKSLAYLLPAIASGLDGRLGWTPTRTRPRLRVPERHTTLYLAPTKALAHDQLRTCRELGLDDWKVSTLDGDSDPEERRYARDFATYVLSNPDMLHLSVLPNHQRWARFLADLRYVVIDEAHRYKGVFGAHVSAVLRRLRRIARHYGSEPVFIVASATIADAGDVVRTLTGVDEAVTVDEDASPHPGLDFALLGPAPHLVERASRLLARLADEGQTLAFTTSRVQAELVARRAQELSDHPERLAAYRGGYLAEDRRGIEAALSSGTLTGVACTNALELGIDIAGMDAVVTVGFPGTLAALWQQVGRAGRSGRDALAVLMAREDPLDAYLTGHPELIFDRPIERTVLYPENPYVLGPHVAAAAQEFPITAADTEFFGPTLLDLVETLTAQGALRRRANGWYWTYPHRAVDAIDLRSMRGKACEVIDQATGRVVGQVDPSASDRTLHPEAVYLHQGEQWIIDSYDEYDRIALARRAEPEYFTQPLSHAGIRILTTQASRPLGSGTVHLGTVELSSQVVGYLRRDAQDGAVWDQTPLDMPERHLTATATWWTLPPDVVDRLPVHPAELPGAVHAAEHTAIGLLPALVPCDRWDIGGLSTVFHADTGQLTVFVHDGQPGGSGFAELGYHKAERWWEATLDRLRTCPCADGCPSCVVSPKCGNGNEPLAKDAAAALVAALIPAHR